MKITKEEYKSDYFTFYPKNMYKELSTLEASKKLLEGIYYWKRRAIFQEKIHEVIDGKKFHFA